MFPPLLRTLVLLSSLVSLSLAISVQNDPVTLLYQNNLNFTDDVNHSSFLLIGASKNAADAQSACSALSESLVSTATARGSASDLTPLLAYAVYRGDISRREKIWLSDGSVSYDGSSLSFSSKQTKGKKEVQQKVLCTQSDRASRSADSKPSTANRVTVRSAAVQNTYTGYRNLKGFRFQGIPYSNSPKRWEYPSLIATRNADYDASKFGPQCYQTGSGTMSEDCLFLNVYTPFIPGGSSATSKKNKKDEGEQRLRPVIFWIHGGAFTGGSGSDSTFDGGNINSRGDVVHVTLNYRLSTLGFLSVPNTTITGNYGIADQIVALDWVRQNIASFGGDPNRITLYGQSAGAASVRALLTSPKSRGKFSAAIPGSNLGGYDYGTTYSQYLTPAAEYQMVGQGIATASSCPSSGNSQEACLKAAPPGTLVNVPNPARFIIVDGTYITQSQLDVVNRKNTANVPTMWGIMRDDGSPFISYTTPGETREQGIRSVLSGQQTQFADAAIAREDLFPVPSGTNETLRLFNLTSNIATDVEFRCVDQATVYSAAKNNVFPKTWYYQYERAYATGFDPNDGTCDAPKTPSHPFGDPSLPYFRCHSGDLYYEFGTLAEFGLHFRDDLDLPFTQLIMDYWTSFATNHDPNPDQEYLKVRGYTSTLQAIKKSGHWDEVTKEQAQSKKNLRLLDYPPTQAAFQRQEQCSVLGLPITLYESK